MRLSTSLRLNAQKGLVTPYDPTLTLSLQFATRQAYVSDFGPLPTFTNATTTARTYVGSDGLLKTAGLNVPRIEFNPITRQCLGLLIEEQRQNLGWWSEKPSNAAWFRSGTTTSANQGVAPDGATTADLVSETTANAQHTILSPGSGGGLTAGTIYTGSAFLKKGTGSTAPDWIFIQAVWTNYAKGFAFNLTTGAVGAVQGGAVPTVKQYSNGWWRVSLTEAANAAALFPSLFFVFTNNTNTAGVTSYAGQTTSNVFVWGVQVEAASFASSYIPTPGAAGVVRSADVCSITGAAFTGFYNQTEGAMVFKGDRVLGNNTGFPRYVSFDDGTSSNRVQLWLTGGPNTFNVTTSGTDSAGLNNSSITDGSRFAMAARYKLNDFAVSQNAGAVLTDTTGPVPTVDRAGIGMAGSLGGPINGHIHTIQYFNAIKTNAQLQALSTP